MLKCFTFLFFFALSLSVFGAGISGTIKDASDNNPLPGVIINIRNTSITTVSDADGKYEFNDLADGKYTLDVSFISYKKESRNVTIADNKDEIIDVTLQSENKTTLKNVTVSGTKVTRTENAVLMEIRKSSSIVSGISAAQIGKTMDRNAADVVKRIPGVTIQDDRFIVVRGLADRYNTVWINDAGTPSSETDKKSFSFDLIPSGLIDRLLIFKTPSPELPGDFAGGMVKIYTTSMPDKNQLNVGIQTSWRQNSTATSFNYEPRSTTDWLGYDDGKRSLPTMVPDETVTSNNPQNDVIAKSFGNNNWTVKNKTLAPDARINLSASNVFKLKNIKIANTFGAAYSNVSTNYNVERSKVDSNFSEQYHYNDLQSENKVSVGLLENLAVVKGNSKIEFKNLYSQIGKSTITQRRSLRDTFNTNNYTDELGYAMAYESKATYSSQLSGTHKGNNDRWKYNWTLGYSDLFKNQPDLRRLLYTRSQGTGLKNDTFYKAQINPAGEPAQGGGMYYSKLFENIYSFSHQFTYTVKIKDYAFDINAGNYIEYKKRNFQARTFAYGYQVDLSGQHPFDDNIQYLPIDQIFTDANIGPNRLRLVEIPDSTNFYQAKNTLIASFISTKFLIGPKITVLGGARFENNKMELKGYSDPTTPSDPVVTTNYLLPSANVSYNLTEKSLVRVAYGKTLNRPEFREWAPNKFYDFDERADVYGSLYPSAASGVAQKGDTLKVSTIQNIDARWEYYPSAGEMIHVGVFYKDIKDPIQRVFLTNGNNVFSFTNELKAYVAGFEIDARKNLVFIDDLLKTNTFKYFMVVGNVSLSKSELTMGKNGVPALNPLKYVPLQGQSPYTFNLGLFYQNDSNGFQGSLLYNIYGSRMYALGYNVVGEESIGELPFKSLDLTLSKTFYKHYIFNVGIQNLLDSKFEFVTDADRNGKFDSKTDYLYKGWKPGRYFSFGLKVRF